MPKPYKVIMTHYNMGLHKAHTHQEQSQFTRMDPDSYKESCDYVCELKLIS